VTAEAALGGSSAPRAAAGRPAAPHTRRYLREIFVELCRIDSSSGNERACADRVRAELAAVGVEVVEDSSQGQTGSNSGNLLARIPARDAQRCVLLCAHLDTVPALAQLEPVLVEGVYENANEGILGADNKAAVAVLLALARQFARDGAPVDLELLFTVGEEVALAGARAFDASVLRADFGYVFDHATPIGEVIVASPSHFRIDAAFRGTAAHAGIRPQDGRSAILAAARAIAAMPLGSLDGGESSANVGLIDGGSAMNVVPERCAIVAEVRSLRDERAEEIVAEVVERVHQAANAPECECDVDVGVQRMFSGYRLAASTPAVRVAEATLADCGFSPRRVTSGGASDANALIAQGVSVVNLANGTERNHEPGERVAAQALEDMLDVALALLEHARG
jgi:tripeptide aminopeptidase